MLFNIPVSRIDTLEKLVARANKKGANILFVKGDEIICDGTLTINVNKIHQHSSETQPIKIRCIQVEVEGIYKIDGWQFLGTIQFTKNGNIIRLADSSFSDKIPEKYKNTPPICEHCGTIRNRKDTYLIYNAERNEFKQVGRTCLLEYTRGLDATVCADIMSCLDKMIEYTDYICDYDTFQSNTGYGVSTREAQGYATALVKKFGYNKSDSENPTSHDLANLLFGFNIADRLSDIKPDYSLIEEINNWLDTVNDNYGYLYNAKLAWLNQFCEARDLGLIASLISTYLKIKNRTFSSNYVGNIGDKIEIKPVSVRVLYSQQWSYYSYSYKLELKDNEGNIYIWSTTNMPTDEDTIKATVKEHTEYKGIKQTVITRGKIL